jgi:hypothetical protein
MHGTNHFGSRLKSLPNSTHEFAVEKAMSVVSKRFKGGIVIAAAISGCVLLGAAAIVAVKVVGKAMSSNDSQSALHAGKPIKPATADELRGLLQWISPKALASENAIPASEAERKVRFRKMLERIDELSRGKSSVAAMSARLLAVVNKAEAEEKKRGDVMKKNVIPLAQSSLASANAFKRQDTLDGIGNLLNAASGLSELARMAAFDAELHAEIVSVRLEAAQELETHYRRMSPASNIKVSFDGSQSSFWSLFDDDTISVTNNSPAVLHEVVLYVRLQGADPKEVFANIFYAEQWNPGQTIRLVCKGSEPRETVSDMNLISVQAFAREEAFETATWRPRK